MSDLAKDYDVEYAIEEEYSDKFYLTGKKESKTLSRTLKITRSISFNLNTLKWLRKNGFLSRWNYFRALFCKKFEERENLFGGIFIAFIILGGVGAALLTLMFANGTPLFANGTPLYPLSPLFGSFNTLLFMVSNSLFLIHMTQDPQKYLNKKLPQELKDKTHYITVPWENRALYKVFGRLEEYDLTQADQKELFDAGSSKTHEINEQINKLMNIKNKLPDEYTNVDQLNIFQDTDKMINELLKLRGLENSEETLKQTIEVLNKSQERKKVAELGISVEELSEASEFLMNMDNKKNNQQSVENSSTQSNEISELLSVINKNDETVEVLIQNHNRSDIHQEKFTR